MTAVLVHSTLTGEALLRKCAGDLGTPDGGFTIDVAGKREVPVGGYAVALPDFERIIGGRVRWEDLRNYAWDHAGELLPRDAGVVRYMGGWRNPADGLAYLDVSQVVATRAEAERLAVAHGQLAYWDFAAGQSVAVGA